MKRKRLVLSTILLVTAYCLITASGVFNYLDTPPFQKPTIILKDKDLLGTWQVQYHEGTIDKIILNSNGTYEQVYESKNTDYLYKSPAYYWQLSYSNDGRTYLIMENGRYYVEGISFFENGTQPSTRQRHYYDPFSEQLITMDNKLILAVVLTRDGKLVLHHMWISSDRGFVIFGSDKEYFQQTK